MKLYCPICDSEQNINIITNFSQKCKNCNASFAKSFRGIISILRFLLRVILISLLSLFYKANNFTKPFVILVGFLIYFLFFALIDMICLKIAFYKPRK